MKMFMVKSKKASKLGNVAIVDTMSGAGLYGQIWYNEVDQCNQTHIQGEDIVYFTPAFRRPPEVINPQSFRDVYNFIVHLYQNGAKYSIDKTKIGVYGNSGGGYIQSGLGLLLS